MFRAIKGSKLFCCVLSVLVIGGIVAGFGNTTSAARYTSRSVYDAQELKEALEDETVDRISIRSSFNVPCNTATKQNGSYFTIKRSVTIEGYGANIKLTRTIGEDAVNGKLQSIFGIEGNGNYDGVQVSMRNLTLDGGADYGTIQGTSRINISADQAKVAGRSLVDVYKKATLNLEEGLTIQNSVCTYSLASLNTSPDAEGSYNYGGAVRVDWDEVTGGGTVNVRSGACIKDTVASRTNRNSSYGGAIGAYSFANLNVYGGHIENCYADMGGAIGCTNRALYGANTSGTFNMTGGEIIGCGADHGGAISVYGTKSCENNLLGGTIKDCTANQGGAVSVETNGNDTLTLNITPYSDNGPLQITGCGNNSYASEYGNQFSGYSGLSLGTSNHNVVIEDKYYTVKFMKFIDDTTPFAVLTVKKGEAFGESFPADPIWGDNLNRDFIEWNTSPDGNGTTITKDTGITCNMTLYARWLCPPDYTQSGDMNITYGDEDKVIEIKDASSPYGGSISYTWVCNDADDKYIDIGDSNCENKFTIPKLGVGEYKFTCYVSTTIILPVETGSSTISTSVKSNPIIVKVAPKTIDIDWSDLSFVCDGKAKIPTATLDGVVEGDEVEVEVTGAQSDVGTFTATATLTGKDAGNYVIADGKDTCEFTIDPAPTATPTASATPTATATPKATTTPTAKPTKAASVTLTLDKKTASVVCGKTVSLKATLKGSKDKITWKSSDSKVATVDSNGKVASKMAGEATITATAAGKSATCVVTILYKDVTNPKDFWYAPTNYLTAKGVVKGYANQTEFRPANVCTRAQMVTFIWRLQGEPKPKATTCKFKDVKKTDYFYNACIWGNENHIVEGYKDGTFGPQIVCARKHAVTFLWRLANKPSPKSKENKFKDVKTSDYFFTATLWASEKKILAGYDDGTFRPDGDCLRRQMVTFLYKYDKFVNGKG